MALLLALPAFGQNHPIPSAPKKSYTPASVRALPELQCKLYVTGTDPAKGLAVYTDDDGYARFFAVRAVRAAAGDAVRSLTLDCTDTHGKSSSYPVDLTSDDTFVPRPLNLANERGTDRPALEGDPLSYTQAELIQAGYGLRPDPKDAVPYAQWLAAATMPARMLAAKHPHPSSATRRRSDLTRPTSDSQGDPAASQMNTVHPQKVVTITAPWWVGSTLNGAPTYVSNQALFNVPTPIPGGDEITGPTEIAIWNGVEGTGANSGLIQGGVSVETTPSSASLGIFRKYCCGNPHSNGYGGSFTPSVGDTIFSQEWYCDSEGNLNPTGGYGCTFLQDFTSGATLSCTIANGSPCWSVPALPSWTSIGTDADFIIEDQTPQLYPGWESTTHYTVGQIAVYDASPYICLTNNKNKKPSTHPTLWAYYQLGTSFTDFAPEVTMSGAAYSTTTGSYSQTVGTDPLVDLLVDFTHSVSHMEISVDTDNDTYFTSSQFLEVGGLAANAAKIESIGVGPNNGQSQNVGDGWVLGSIANSNGDYGIFRWLNSSWVQVSGAGTQLAVGPEGYPWVINHAGAIFYWNGSEFELAPGNACASWIGVGANNYFAIPYGDPWILGCNLQTNNNYNIYQLQGSNLPTQGGTWVQQPGEATRIAVGWGTPWVINSAGNVFYWVNGNFTVVPGNVCATSISVGPATSTLPFGEAWITGCHFQSTGYDIYQLGENWIWNQVPGQAIQISVSPDIGVPWIVDSNGHIYL
jgi:hypothetical protein